MQFFIFSTDEPWKRFMYLSANVLAENECDFYFWLSELTLAILQMWVHILFSLKKDQSDTPKICFGDVFISLFITSSHKLPKTRWINLELKKSLFSMLKNITEHTEIRT